MRARLLGSSRGAVVLVAQKLLRMTLRLLSGIVPHGRSVVVSAFPETEGNAVEVARALVRHYDGQVVWLTEGPQRPPAIASLAENGLLLVEKASLSGLLHYLRAEAVFFTHGLYGSPRPSRRKPLVNLWHGDGPKATRPGGGAGSLIPSTYVVAGSELFGHQKAAAFEVPPTHLLVTGNPRTDQFWQTPQPEALRALGITGDFVVWMPTFRRSRAVGAVRPWSDTRDVAGERGSEALHSLIEGLSRRGLQLVVKPHPMDADRRRRDGVVAVSDEDLTRCGTTLYSLLGQSRGLVTDYSSVWVDYLLLDRPIAFFVPDRHVYARALLPADVLDWVPGEVVQQDPRPFQAFLADLDAWGAHGAVRRKEVVARIGLNQSRTSADDLIVELAHRGVFGVRSVR